MILSLQLPFAVIPLVHLTSDRKRMGKFANGAAVKVAAWSCSVFILVLNGWYLWTQAVEWTRNSSAYRPLVIASLAVGGLCFLSFLAIIFAWPVLNQSPRSRRAVAITLRDQSAPLFLARSYSRILVPLDHSDADQEALGNALALAKMHDAKVILLHVEEGVTSQLFGALSSTAEIAEGQDYFANVTDSLRQQRIAVEVMVRHGKRPAAEIAAAVRECKPDLVVMASHGHRGLKDLILGTTINAVRHQIGVPLLIVNGSERHG